MQMQCIRALEYRKPCLTVNGNEIRDILRHRLYNIICSRSFLQRVLRASHIVLCCQPPWKVTLNVWQEHSIVYFGLCRQMQCVRERSLVTLVSVFTKHYLEELVFSLVGGRFTCSYYLFEGFIGRWSSREGNPMCVRTYVWGTVGGHRDCVGQSIGVFVRWKIPWRYYGFAELLFTTRFM